MQEPGDFHMEDGEKEALEGIVSKGLCDPCLGRCLAKRGRGLTNEERGELMRTALDPVPEAVKAEDCHVCEGLTGEYGKFEALVLKALEPYEFETFLLGSRIDPVIQEQADEIAALLDGGDREEVKSEVNREVGKRVAHSTGKEVDFEMPDIVVLLDTRFDRIELDVRSVYIYGRYRKLKRGIPQTKWPCKACWGKGCRKCDGTGRIYETSVEEIVAAPVLRVLKGDEQAFHGMGREDLDALMLGNGRPFILEIKRPRRRQVPDGDLEDLGAMINKEAGGEVEVLGLRYSNKGEIKEIKGAKVDKTYRIRVDLSNTVDETRIRRALAELDGTVAHQRTPRRVAHRRADKIRRRTVKKVEPVKVRGSGLDLRIRGESGIYIKELITGDEGRTTPSLAELIETGCEVLELDVVEIHDDGMEE